MWRNNYVDGNRPGAPVTREEVVIMMNRMRKNFLTLIVGSNERVGEIEKRLQAIESMK